MKGGRLKKIYLMYEIETRELPSRILLAEKLIQKKNNVEIFQHSQLLRVCLFKTPGVLFIKSSPYQLDLLLKVAKLRGFRIISSQEEGLHFFGDEESFGTLYPLTFSRNTAELIDLYLAWHQNDFETALRVGVPAEKIRIVGNIRLQIVNQLSKQKVTNTKNMKILLITNFNYAEQLEKYISKSNQRKQSDYNKIFNKSIEFYSQNLNMLKDSEKIFVDFIQKSTDLKLEIILRRYFYDQTSYNYNLYPNLTIDENYLIGKAINDSDLVVHYGSSAAVEALCGHRLPILLTSDLEFHDRRMLTLGPNFTQVDSLLEWISSLSEMKLESELSKSQSELVVNYGINFNLDSLNLIADEINKECNNYLHYKKGINVELQIFLLYLRILLTRTWQFFAKKIKSMSLQKHRRGAVHSKAAQLSSVKIADIAADLGIFDNLLASHLKISRNGKSLILFKNS